MPAGHVGVIDGDGDAAFVRTEFAAQTQLNRRARHGRRLPIKIAGNNEGALRTRVAGLKPQTASKHHYTTADR